MAKLPPAETEKRVARLKELLNTKASKEGIVTSFGTFVTMGEIGIELGRLLNRQVLAFELAFPDMLAAELRSGVAGQATQDIAKHLKCTIVIKGGSTFLVPIPEAK